MMRTVMLPGVLISTIVWDKVVGLAGIYFIAPAFNSRRVSDRLKTDPKNVHVHGCYLQKK